jgi:hypothetical protein
VHFTFTTDENKNLYFTIFDLQQNNDQFPVETNPENITFGNKHIIQNILNDDTLFNCNKTERIQNEKRKRHNNPNYLNQEENKNSNNASERKYSTKSQKQKYKQNYLGNKKEKMESRLLFIYPQSHLDKKDTNCINLHENKNTPSEKRKLCHDKNRKTELQKERSKRYRQKNAEKIKEKKKIYHNNFNITKNKRTI